MTIQKFDGYKANKVRNYMITDFCDNINELDENLADKIELFDEQYTALLSFNKRVSRFLRYINFKIWVCISVIAFFSAMNGFVADFLGDFIFKNRIYLLAQIESEWLRLLAWCGITILFGLVTTFLCDKFSKEAEGSGIPQIKTFLSGLKLNNYLNARSYFVKMAGLILIDGGGYFTGKEGPLIRLSAMVARKIMEFSYFNKIAKNSFLRNQMMIVSVAAGVVSTFGASYGGLMFAIEICTTTFLIANLWRAFVCATIVKVLYTYINSSDGLDIFVDLQSVDLLSISMLTHSVMLGLLGGWLGSLWIYTFCRLQ